MKARGRAVCATIDMVMACDSTYCCHIANDLCFPLLALPATAATHHRLCPCLYKTSMGTSPLVSLLPFTHICPHSYKMSMTLSHLISSHLPAPTPAPTNHLCLCSYKTSACPFPSISAHASLPALIQDKHSLVSSYHAATAAHYLCPHSFKMSAGLFFPHHLCPY